VQVVPVVPGAGVAELEPRPGRQAAEGAEVHDDLVALGAGVPPAGDLLGLRDQSAVGRHDVHRDGLPGLDVTSRRFIERDRVAMRMRKR
jgi:hypothetical protein